VASRPQQRPSRGPARQLSPRFTGGVLDELKLYDRNLDGDESGLRCEWCGRPGQALPSHVRSPEGEVEFAEPVLCPVCQGLVGYLHPHPSQQRQPPAPAGADRHRNAHAWAAGVVSRLLTERFVGEGRPRPDWAEGPGWAWPPRR